MSRETRVNLILLAVLVVAMAPGGYILFKKKIDPTARPMNRPDFARRHLVFIDPTPAPRDLPRLMPSMTATWVSDLARREMASGMLTLPPAQEETDAEPSPPLPIMSERRLAQVVSVRGYADGFDLGLLVWNLPRGTKSASLSAEISGGAEADESDSSVIASQTLTLPAAIKRDLQQSGLPAPPQQVLWAITRITGASASGPITLSIDVDADGIRLTDTVSFDPNVSAAVRPSSASR